jgi:hypothetical protein
MPRSVKSASKKKTAVVLKSNQSLTRGKAPAVYFAPPEEGVLRLPDAGPPDLPPLPDALDVDDAATDSFPPVLPAPPLTVAPRPLRAGCYLMRFTPAFVFGAIAGTHYDGTFRVDRNVSVVTASGDLYAHAAPQWPIAGPHPVVPEPNPAAGIPVFPRSRYTYYLRVAAVREFPAPLRRVEIAFDRFRFNAASRTWTSEGRFTATMSWTAPPAGYPSATDYLTGDVRNASGSIVGTLTLGWVSRYLRRATIEIDRCAPCEVPLDNGSGVDWQRILDLVGWEVKVLPSDANVPEPSGESWSDGEMHAAMLARRDASNLDAEWRYHVLCVRRIDSTPRGIMYDSGAVDSNNVPREGVGISSHWIVPDTPEWGLTRLKRFGTQAGPYFRTAVHELGHAMGLYHNTIDLGIMNTTDVIAQSSLGGPTPFPNNIQWAHATDDQRRLRHLPDMHVRPGGIPFGAPFGPDAATEDAVGIDVEVSPVVAAFPIGAPVRVEFALVNRTAEPLPVPASLSMKSGHVRGSVIDPAGNAHPFLPMQLCLEENALRTLAPGEPFSDSLTLLRGPRGSLFPGPGAYRVVIEVTWAVGHLSVIARGETSVMITSAQTQSHAEAALRVLSTPDTVVALVVGGDHLEEGLAAIQAALNDEVLRPHYAAIEAKRVARRFGARAPDFDRASALVGDPMVATRDELGKLAKLAVSGPKTTAPSQAMAQNVRDAARRASADDIADSIVI